MPSVEILNREGKASGKLQLSDDVFGVEPNHSLMHQAVLSYLANQRQGTHSTKRRGEVRGGGRKPWRQKGTGRARHGSIRAPQWVGGGVVFGPHPRDYSFHLSKKERQGALRSALSAKLADGEIVIVDELKIEQPKTKQMNEILTALGLADKSVLIVLEEADPNVFLSARNIPSIVGITRAGEVNTYDVLKAEVVLMTKAGAELLDKRLSQED